MTLVEAPVAVPERSRPLIVQATHREWENSVQKAAAFMKIVDTNAKNLGTHLEVDPIDRSLLTFRLATHLALPNLASRFPQGTPLRVLSEQTLQELESDSSVETMLQNGYRFEPLILPRYFRVLKEAGSILYSLYSQKPTPQALFEARMALARTTNLMELIRTGQIAGN